VAVVPGHLSTALFAISAGDHASLKRELRSTLKVSFLVTAAATAVTVVVGKPLLSLFGAGYGSAATALVLLSITGFPFAVKVHYMAVARVQGWLMKCAAVVTVGSAVELVFAAVGEHWNMNGVAAGYLIGSTLEALVLWPAVAAAAGYSRSRRELKLAA
jgi:O-antigen/teichoic acid export membrane protein